MIVCPSMKLCLEACYLWASAFAKVLSGIKLLNDMLCIYIKRSCCTNTISNLFDSESTVLNFCLLSLVSICYSK